MDVKMLDEMLAETETKMPVMSDNRLAFIFSCKKKEVQIVKADGAKMKLMSPFLRRHIEQNRTGDAVLTMQKCITISNFKLIAGFLESGNIACSDWKRLIKLTDALGAKANGSLLFECRRLLQKAVSVHNVWEVVRAMKDYRGHRIVYAKILSQKPDACIKSLDLSQLSLNYAYAFKEFGEFQDESSYHVLASALNIMDKISAGEKYKERIEAVRKKFPQLGKRCKPAQKDKKSKKEPVKVDYMEVDLLVDTLNDLFIEKVVPSMKETRTPDVVLCSSFKKPPPLLQGAEMEVSPVIDCTKVELKAEVKAQKPDVKTRRLDSSVSEGLKSEFSEKKLLTEKALPTEAVEDVEAFDIYQDVADDNICAVSQVPLLFSIKFTAETELCLVGFELLSRSCAPNTNRAKRVMLDPEYQENLFLTVEVCHDETVGAQTVLKKKLYGPSLRGDSKIIFFDEDEIFLSKGFECTVQLEILDFCWYRELPRPTTDKFVSRGGQLLLTNVAFEVIGEADVIPDLCPISRMFFRPVDCKVSHA